MCYCKQSCICLLLVGIVNFYSIVSSVGQRQFYVYFYSQTSASSAETLTWRSSKLLSNIPCAAPCFNRLLPVFRPAPVHRQPPGSPFYPRPGGPFPTWRGVLHEVHGFLDDVIAHVMQITWYDPYGCGQWIRHQLENFLDVGRFELSDAVYQCPLYSNVTAKTNSSAQTPAH